MAYESQVRATFRDTLKAQEKLRVELDNLDNNNLFVSPDKRGKFFEQLANAMLGLDYEKTCMIHLPDKTSLKIVMRTRCWE